MIETTAHALAATLGLLAFSTDLQDEIFEHIIAVIGHDRAPVSGSDTRQYGFSSGFQVFDDYPKLNKVLAAFYEALRMFRELEFVFVLK